MGTNKKQTSVRGPSRRDILKYGLYGSVMAGLSPSLWLGGCSRRRGGKRPNIFLIIVDTLRPDHLGCYGYPRNTSPNIDQFAKNALLFENCFSHAPTTSPSCACILSGFLSHETKSLINGRPLSSAVEILPEMLQKQGYKNAAVVSNYVLRKRTNWTQGFDIFDDTMDDKELNRNFPERIAKGTTDRAIELINRFSKDPLFMWIHYQDPHGPYTPPKQYAGLFWNPDDKKPRNLKVNKSLSGWGGIPSYQKLPNSTDYHYYVSQYDAEIRYQDEHFKRLIETLKEQGLFDESLIILTSDHGEGMGEHNYYFAHGGHLYNSLTHVPLIIKQGGELLGRKNYFVQHLDIVPTALNCAGVKPDSRFRGCDLREQNDAQPEIFARQGSMFTLIYDGFKVIYFYRARRYELFDLKADPNEEHNLINNPEYRERAKDLTLRLNRIAKEDRLKLNVYSKPLKLSREEIEKLKSLGYVR